MQRESRAEKRQERCAGAQALRGHARMLLALAAACAMLAAAGGAPGWAQTAAPQATQTKKAERSPARRTAAHRRSRKEHGSPAEARKAAPAVPVAPPAPKMPDWPVNDHPQPARVVWDSHGLQIVANNSSLEQILKDVAAATGAKVQGLSKDQRIFGTYGPGQPRDVLSQLLEGTGFNVVMTGDAGGGVPGTILLSTQGPAPAPSANRPASNNVEEETVEEEEPQPPEPEPNRFQPGLPPRTPQQIEQMQMERQQEMERQREESRY